MNYSISLQNMKEKDNKSGLKEEMKKVSANIGRLEIMRKNGTYVPLSKIESEKRKFRKLSVQYKQSLLF